MAQQQSGQRWHRQPHRIRSGKLDPSVGNGSVGTLSGLALSFARRQKHAGNITDAIEKSFELGISDVINGTTIS